MSISRELDQELDRRAARLSRLQDYQQQETTGQIRDRLVARWKEEYPEGAAKSSTALKPLIRMAEWRKTEPSTPDEIWFNDTYNVTVRRSPNDPVFGSRSGGIVQIGISSHDGTARHDWRDFQAIKNQIAGEECEAFELYPAESRLLDPSNYYTLWCFPGVRNLKIGQPVRLVRDQDEAWAPQRRMARASSDPQAVQEKGGA